MKVKKTLPIIMFCLGAAALIFALYATISPMIRSHVNPFEVDASEKITVEQDADGDWAFSGKLKKYSDREQSIIYLSVEGKRYYLYCRQQRCGRYTGENYARSGRGIRYRRILLRGILSRSD